jgi:hypothetical protein
VEAGKPRDCGEMWSEPANIGDYMFDAAKHRHARAMLAVCRCWRRDN